MPDMWSLHDIARAYRRSYMWAWRMMHRDDAPKPALAKGQKAWAADKVQKFLAKPDPVETAS